ncbi:MAG: four helix bundle protein [Endomicrobia bacterium]|nr:four helix bundle protein [Endomicrobiia bacterium]MCL2506820.1 four helix bundle protein [Endomicrobiia bacterium]
MYKNLQVWTKSVELIKVIYTIADKLPKSEEYNLKIQIKRAVVSVALNIAEGKCRQSSKDFAHFLNVACSSLREVEAVLNICESLDFFKNLNDVYEKKDVLSKMINSLRTKLKDRE